MTDQLRKELVTMILDVIIASEKQGTKRMRAQCVEFIRSDKCEVLTRAQIARAIENLPTIDT